MNRIFSKAAFLLGIALTFSAATFAQESKVKIEGDGYELKIKQDGDDYKRKQKGIMPYETMTEHHSTTTLKQGETVTTVKHGDLPVAQQSVVKKKSYSSAKKCDCSGKVAARKPVAKKAVAYKAKKTNTVRVAASPRIVHDTVFVTRVDTFFNMNETQGFAGYDTKGIGLVDDFEKLKIERSKNGKIEMKKEYRDGREEKREFESEAEFRTYLQFKNF
ncbi:MAG: hypothetical protein EOP56_13950 [Sphingobacteriales bacterium]|nr:MAG: hypothetical protein EOP56_13950 [Sphingobacteriales bacterium]